MAYVPERGDLVWISMDPHAGREQAGRRPALVLSKLPYNTRVGLAIFCPVTGQSKGYETEVRIPAEVSIAGVVLSDQVKSFDWRARQVEFVEVAPADLVRQVLQKFVPLVFDLPGEEPGE